MPLEEAASCARKATRFGTKSCEAPRCARFFEICHLRRQTSASVVQNRGEFSKSGRGGHTGAGRGEHVVSLGACL
jgi:hypothetical protein